MKKLFTFMMMAVACIAVMQATTEVTVTKTATQIVTENSYTVSAGSSATCYTSLKLDNYITVSTTGTANCGSFWGSGTQDWRLYQNQSGNIVITAAEGATLKSVTLTYKNANNGTLADFPSGEAATVSGSEVSCSVTNTGDKTNGQVRITEFSVTYETEADVVATPEITVKGDLNKKGQYIDNATVTITCATDGASLYYTLDGTTPTVSSTKYTSAFTVSETCTVTALAVNGTATATVSQEITIGEADPIDTNEYLVDEITRSTLDFGGATAGYVDFTTAALTSGATYAGQAYAANANTIQLRTSGSCEGLVSTKSGGNIRKVNITWNSGTASARKLLVYASNSPYTSAADLYADDANKVGELGTTDTELEIEGDYKYVGIRSSASALYLDGVTFSWVEAAAAAVEDPVIVVEDATVVGPQTVTITCATEGATIHYTLDGNDPTTESAVYSAALTISESCTVKAIAVKGTDKSNVISKVITINEAISVADAAALDLTADSNKEVTIQFNNAKVVYNGVSGANTYVYVREGDDALLLFNTGLTLPQNALLNGYVTLKFSPYNNLPEFAKATNTTDANLKVVESTEDAQPLNVAVQDVADGKNMNNLVIVKDAQVLVDGSNYYVTVDGETQSFQLYDRFSIDIATALADVDGKTFDITGLVSVYKTTAQLFPVAIAEHSSAQLGDVNGDGIIDVADVVALANYVMGETPEGFDVTVSNINGDEIIDVSDVVALANIVMGAGE